MKKEKTIRIFQILLAIAFSIFWAWASFLSGGLWGIMLSHLGIAAYRAVGISLLLLFLSSLCELISLIIFKNSQPSSLWKFLAGFNIALVISAFSALNFAYFKKSHGSIPAYCTLGALYLIFVLIFFGNRFRSYFLKPHWKLIIVN